MKKIFNAKSIVISCAPHGACELKLHQSDQDAGLSLCCAPHGACELKFLHGENDINENMLRPAWGV